MAREPVAELHPGFSSSGATATEWAEARERLEGAEIYWVTTVRPDGRPHVMPLVAAWLDDALFFSTGENERKAQNLDHNPHVVMTTGCNAFTG
jgi:general stress protein 26